jgi:CHAT domain-containing protein
MNPVEERLAYLIQIYRVKRRLHSPDLERLREELLATAEEVRSEGRSRAGRLWDSQENDTRLRDATADQIGLGADDALMFLLVESAKSRTLLDQMAHLAKEVADPRAAQAVLLLEKEMLLFKADSPDGVLGAQMRLASNIPVFSPFDTPQRGRTLAALEAAYTEADAGFRGVEAPVSFPLLKSTLAPGELMIEYWLPYQPAGAAVVCYALCITRDRFRAVPIPLGSLQHIGMAGAIWIDGKAPIEASALGDRVVLTRTAIEKGDEARANAGLRELHDLVMGPVIDAGFDPSAFDRCIVIPAGALHALPFGALLDASGTPLYEKVAIVTAPSASVWARNARRPREPVRGMLAFADPAFDPATHLGALPQARKEVQDIEGLLPGVEADIYMGNEATESRLVSRSSRAGILHFATHATFPEHDAMDLHRLALAAGGGQDGEVRAEEIRRLDLGRTELTVLSVCNGGIYRFGPGGELHGLVPAFLAAGARNVLATVWPIGDAAGREFVVDFYAGLLQYGPAQALRRTAQRLWRQGAPIGEWASFVLVGDGRPLLV